MYNKKESTEDYLEKIYMFKKEHGCMRAIDLAKYMNFSKASVSVALKKLKDVRYVVVNDVTGEIELTELGIKIAEETYQRHTILTKTFSALGVNKETAENDACKIEHLLSKETFEAIKKHLDKNNK